MSAPAVQIEGRRPHLSDLMQRLSETEVHISHLVKERKTTPTSPYSRYVSFPLHNPSLLPTGTPVAACVLNFEWQLLCSVSNVLSFARRGLVCVCAGRMD